MSSVRIFSMSFTCEVWIFHHIRPHERSLWHYLNLHVTLDFAQFKSFWTVATFSWLIFSFGFSLCGNLVLPLKCFNSAFVSIISIMTILLISFYETLVWRYFIKRSRLIQYYPVWSSVIQCDPVWTRVIQCDQEWSRVYQSDLDFRKIQSDPK